MIIPHYKLKTSHFQIDDSATCNIRFPFLIFFPETSFTSRPYVILISLIINIITLITDEAFIIYNPYTPVLSSIPAILSQLTPFSLLFISPFSTHFSSTSKLIIVQITFDDLSLQYKFFHILTSAKLHILGLCSSNFHPSSFQCSWPISPLYQRAVPFTCIHGVT